MANPAGIRKFRRSLAQQAASRLLAVPVFALFGLALLALVGVAYALWPRWPAPPAGPDAPTLPIVVAGETFNVPPAALRRPVQRRSGTQERIDLAFQWPSLAPPDPAKPLAERLFVTIAAATTALGPAERLASVYPRYAEATSAGPEGLAAYGFRDGTPYEGEDLLVDPVTPQTFAVRCSRRTGPRTPGICLYDRRIGSADITVRFPRDWLPQWRALAAGIDELIAGMRSAGMPAR